MIGPVLAPVGTVTRIWFGAGVLTAVTGCVLNQTAGGTRLEKLTPSMVTVVCPALPRVGKKPVMTGRAVTMKSCALVPDPPPVVTVTLPVVAGGTTTRICV